MHITINIIVIHVMSKQTQSHTYISILYTCNVHAYVPVCIPYVSIIQMEKYKLYVFRPVTVINESVIEHAVDLVHPEAWQLVSLRHVSLGHQQHAAHHAREVTQVEHVVRLVGCRQEGGHSTLVYGHRGLDHDLIKEKDQKKYACFYVYSSTCIHMLHTYVIIYRVYMHTIHVLIHVHMCMCMCLYCYCTVRVFPTKI